MISGIKGMLITLISTINGLRNPVTRQYPTVPTPVQPLPSNHGESLVAHDSAALADLRNLFSKAKEEVFEDGIESAFSRDLEAYIMTHGSGGVNELARLCKETIGSDAVAEALRYLGQMDDRNTRSSRFRLLTRCLWHSSPVVRDAAAVGLALLEDKAAIPYLRQVAEQEDYAELREDLYRVIQLLGS